MTSEKRKIILKLINGNHGKRFLTLFSPETSSGMLTTLALTTLVIFFASWLYLAQVGPLPPPKPITTLPRRTPRFPQMVVIPMEKSGATSLTAGNNDDFFVVYGKEIRYYRLDDQPDASVMVTENFSFPLDEEPTAIHFVRNTASPFVGKLIVAYPHRLEIIIPDDSHPNGTLFANLVENSRLTDVVTDYRFIYAADAGLGRILQFDTTGNRVKEIGTADAKTGFDGFSTIDSPFFDLDIFPQANILYAARPDRFRVEAFSAETGEWLPERSWENPPSHDHGFSGKSNPAVLIALANQSFLTAESGLSPRVKNFNATGDFLAEISEPELSAPLSDSQSPLLAVALASEGRTRLLILTPNGNLGCLTVPP